MTRDPQVTPQEQAEEDSVRFGLVIDTWLITTVGSIGLLGGSLTLIAELIRAVPMNLMELFSYVVMRRIHRGRLADLEFGTGKLEQAANTLIGGAMLGGAVWIIVGALALFTGERAAAAPFGLAMAAMAGAINLYCNFIAWAGMRAATRAESTLVMLGQLRSRTVKLASSLLVLITMTVAALSTDEEVIAWADALGAAFVAITIVYNAIDMLSSGIVDLLDRSAGPDVREAIDRALALHTAEFDRLARIRSRRSGRVVFIELGLRFDPVLSIAEVNRRIEALKESIGREIEHCDVSVLAFSAEGTA
jgi:divalent metal cation (Fe/Co/Zn/Cd) transporter